MRDVLIVCYDGLAGLPEIEDKRATQRLTHAGKPPNKRTAPTRLTQGHTTTNWKQALTQLTTTYPDPITPYL